MARPYLEAAASVVIATSAANLRAVDSNLFQDAQHSQIQATDTFDWDAASVAADDGVNVIIPDDIVHPAPGRWLVIPNVKGPTTAVTNTGVPSWDGTGRLLQDNADVRIKSGALEIGATVASAGNVRGDDTFSIQAWALTGGVNMPMLSKSASDHLSVGLGSAAGAVPDDIFIGAGGDIISYINGNVRHIVSATSVELRVPLFRIHQSELTPQIIQAADPADGVVCQTLLTHAQDATHGVNGTGGDFNLRPGAGPTAGGQIAMQNGAAVDRVAVDDVGVGFFAVGPVARQNIVGAKAGNAALTDLLTKLALTGLITDATT